MGAAAEVNDLPQQRAIVQAILGNYRSRSRQTSGSPLPPRTLGESGYRLRQVNDLAGASGWYIVNSRYTLLTKCDILRHATTEPFAPKHSSSRHDRCLRQRRWTSQPRIGRCV